MEHRNDCYAFHDSVLDCRCRRQHQYTILSPAVAIYYKVLIALPFTTILEVLLILIFVGFPLTLFGGIAGRRAATDFSAPW